jgi:UTP--glucose-1-phosphate uridylyltransferase
MKGLIVAAGYGTRFLPVTKTIPKEMLPLIDTPSIDFIVQEFVNSGITDILIITSRRKKGLDDYFDREMELETVFTRERAAEKGEKIRPAEANIFFIRQREMRGTGHALLLARPFMGDSPFVAAYPDDLHFGTPPLARQLVDVYEATGCSVMATIHDPPNLHRYGVLEIAPDNLHVTDIVEKPTPGTEPSREVSIGRYLYTPDIFENLQEGWEKHIGSAGSRAAKGSASEGTAMPGAYAAADTAAKGEYYHTYALKQLMKQNRVAYKRTEGLRLDTGTPEGYLRAILRYASERPELRAVLEEELKFTGNGTQ